jgi:glycosyltransferase involved in cell wall biosynthesis
MNVPSASRSEVSSTPDILCLSHLRWDWVFQRPQHLLTRAAKDRRVWFVEEPVADPAGCARLALARPHPNVTVATPHVPEGLNEAAREHLLRDLLDLLIGSQHLSDYVLWYYTPMALPFSRHLSPAVTVYDCMDQLSAFAGAPVRLAELELEMLSRCDAVFTGGLSLYESKRPLHANVHCFPSSVDAAHFSAARDWTPPPRDQADMPRPRLGYFGVIDERLDLPLIAAVAHARPAWQVVLVGPVTKIDERDLPRAANIHYLGAKRYEELPAYVAGWDVALMPFARNEATRYISPTKTPEYLAAGKPVVSTSIPDVVRTYGDPGYVRIADTADEFIGAVESSLLDDPLERLAKVDALLKEQSWEQTWSRMDTILDGVLDHAGGRSSCLTM